MGFASYMRRKRPSLFLESRGYMKMPPRESTRNTAATCERPGCRKAFSSGSQSLPSASFGQRSTEKMVPTEMLTSMLEEPSSGSNSSRYSPRGYWVGIGRGFSISSEARAARLPPHSLASSKISLDSTSSFFCTSPCTLRVAAPPRPSPSAPLLTRVLIALQARAMVSISRRRSALISFLSRCRSIRNCVRWTRRMGAFYASRFGRMIEALSGKEGSHAFRQISERGSPAVARVSQCSLRGRLRPGRRVLENHQEGAFDRSFPHLGQEFAHLVGQPNVFVRAQGYSSEYAQQVRRRQSA